MSVSARMLLLSAALVSAAPSVGLAQPKPAKPSNAQKMQEAAVSDIPRCTRKLGTVSIANGDDPYGWTQFDLVAAGEAAEGPRPEVGLFQSSGPWRWPQCGGHRARYRRIPWPAARLQCRQGSDQGGGLCPGGGSPGPERQCRRRRRGWNRRRPDRWPGGRSGGRHQDPQAGSQHRPLPDQCPDH